MTPMAELTINELRIYLKQIYKCMQYTLLMNKVKRKTKSRN